MPFLLNSSTSGSRGHSIHAALFVMLVALCLGLSACGGGGDGGGFGGGPTVHDDHGDWLTTATRVAPDSNTYGVLTAGDEDWFEIPLSREGTLLVYTSGGTDTGGELWNEFQTVVSRDGDGGSGLNFRIETSVRDLTHYVRVRGHGGSASGPYTLHVRFTPTSTPGDIHGDTRQTATRIAPVSVTAGMLTRGDEDWFRFTVDVAGRLDAHTSGNHDTSGVLYDASGRRLDSYCCGGSNRNFRMIRDITAGTYYIRVTADFAGREPDYTLNVNFAPGGVDHGDSRQSASLVATGSDTDSLLTSGDVDYFRVVVDRPGELTVYTSGGTDTVGRLEDSGGTALASDDNGGSGNNFRIVRDVAAGTYYVRVTSGPRFSTSFGSFTLHVRFAPASTVDDHGERPSDATAVTTTSNTPGELTAGDEDWFRIVVDQPGRLTVYSSGSTDTVGRLRDSRQGLLASSNDEGSGNNFRIEHDVTAGTYYVEVRGRISASTAGPYTLHVRFNATPSGGDDHGDTCTDGTAVDLGSTTNIEVQRDGELTAGDTDYFRVTVGAGRLRAFTSGNTDTVGRLESTGGTQLASDDNGGSGSNFQIEQSVSGGTYCVRVTGAGGRTGPYTLHLCLLEEIIVGMSGDVRVNITWSADVDLDLYVTNPCGQTLGYGEGDRNTCQGFTGEWDVDDIGDSTQPNNPNAENAAWPDGAPSGRYIVRVNYFRGAVPASYTVRIFRGTQLTGTYPGRLDPATDYRMRRFVTDFTYTGSSSSQGTETSRFEAGSQALSQAARSLGMSAVTAMSSRGQSQGGSSLTLAGQHVSFGNGATSPKSPFDDLSFTGKEPDWTERDDSERSGSWGEFLRGSRFDVALDEETRVWGEAHGIRGSNESRFLGFERSFGEGFSAGVAFSDTANEGNFGLAESESLEASLASAYQYLHLSPGPSTELWSLVGTGQGELSLTDDIGTVATDLSMQMLAFGSSHGLGPLIADFAPTVSADGFLVRLESERRAGLRPLAGEASRLRTGVLFERPFEGDGWTPRIGFGVRHEDDERGVATRTEVMAGFGYVLDRLRVDGMAYLSPTGSGFAEPAGAGVQTRDSGARLTVYYRAAPDGRGLAVSVDALAGSVPDAPVWKTDDVTGDATSVHLQAGYGFASGPGRWMPYGEIRLDGDEQRLREGVRQDIGAMSLDLYGEHRLGATSEHGLHVGVTARY